MKFVVIVETISAKHSPEAKLQKTQKRIVEEVDVDSCVIIKRNKISSLFYCCTKLVEKGPKAF